MRKILNNVAGLAILVLLTLFLGVIGFVIGASFWGLSVYLTQRAEDRQMMRDYYMRKEA